MLLEQNNAHKLALEEDLAHEKTKIKQLKVEVARLEAAAAI